MIVNGTQHSRRKKKTRRTYATGSVIVSLKYPSHHLNTYDSTKEVMALDKRKCAKNGKGVCVCAGSLFFVHFVCLRK